MSKKVIFDASALLALIQEEKGAEIVKPLLKDSIMLTINVAEVLTTLQNVGIPPDDATEYISLFISELVDFDLEQARAVANLYPQVKTKSLSLGDRACLTLGAMYKAPIYTTDKAWNELESLLEIHLIR